MTATIPNIAKGRGNELARRVDGNDPSTSGFVVFLLRDTGIDAIDVLRDFDEMAALLASNTECSVASYGREVITDTGVSAPTVDDTGNLQNFDIPDFDFGALEAGQTISAVVTAYAPDTTGATSTMIPVHIDLLDSAGGSGAPVPTNGELFHVRAPSGFWQAQEP